MTTDSQFKLARPNSSHVHVTVFQTHTNTGWYVFGAAAVNGRTVAVSPIGGGSTDFGVQLAGEALDATGVLNRERYDWGGHPALWSHLESLGHTMSTGVSDLSSMRALRARLAMFSPEENPASLPNLGRDTHPSQTIITRPSKDRNGNRFIAVGTSSKRARRYNCEGEADDYREHVKAAKWFADALSWGGEYAMGGHGEGYAFVLVVSVGGAS